jgi:rare lipoprotein A
MTLRRIYITVEFVLLVLFTLALLMLALPVISRAQSDSTEQKNAANSSGESTAVGKPLKAKASWYGPGFEGHKTSTGQPYNPRKLTAASSKLPLGSTAEVKNLKNGRQVKVKINDCGPYVAGRKVDLSSRAANDLKMKHAGVVPVQVKVVKKPPDAQPCASR